MLNLLCVRAGYNLTLISKQYKKMSETTSHKRAKAKAAGTSEKPISRNRIIDSLSPKRATEIERSGNQRLLEKAARRLKSTRKPQKVLIVPNTDILKGVQAMKNTNTKVTVKNLKGSKRRSV